jgi:hypothetical protein
MGRLMRRLILIRLLHQPACLQVIDPWRQGHSQAQPIRTRIVLP